MQSTAKLLKALVAFCGVIMLCGTSRADELITSFETFFENALYGSWSSPLSTIDSGPESYVITATGYGSNYVYIGDLGVIGAGNTDIKLDVTLSGPPSADGHLGPLLQIIDGDGTHYHFRWYGQLLGNNLLTRKVSTPDFVTNPGTTPGLDLNNLLHMHMEIDPGGFGTSGAYTVSWNELSLITVTGTPGDFNDDGDVDGRDFLIWQRGGSPTALSPGDLQDWQTNYGAEGPLTAVTAIPEPSAISLLVFAAVSAISFKRPSHLMA
jgi:hypothetical protein